VRASSRVAIADRLALVTIAVAALVGCGADSGGELATTAGAVRAANCLVRIHGRTETGSAPVQRDGYAELSPTGNAEFGDGHVWLYDTDERYADARRIVAGAIDGAECERVVLDGFSNGGAFAARLFCQGESFGGTVVGVIIDDPVPDDSTNPCDPAPGVEVALYWTGALSGAAAGIACESIGYTCGGELLVGIDAFADGLRTEILVSPHVDHVQYQDAPEIGRWFAG